MPENHETQISLEGTLTLLLAVQRNFCASVFRSYDVGNMKKKNFAISINSGGTQNPHIQMNYIMASSNIL